jgi:hypothetical protein
MDQLIQLKKLKEEIKQKYVKEIKKTTLQKTVYGHPLNNDVIKLFAECLINDSKDINKCDIPEEFNSFKKNNKEKINNLFGPESESESESESDSESKSESESESKSDSESSCSNCGDSDSYDSDSDDSYDP